MNEVMQWIITIVISWIAGLTFAILVTGLQLLVMSRVNIKHVASIMWVVNGGLLSIIFILIFRAR